MAAALIFAVVGTLFLLQWGPVTGQRTPAASPADLDGIISELSHSIASSQIQESGGKGDSEVQKGVYPCYVRVNFVGTREAEILRRDMVAFDNNAFVTAWVTILLLEAAATSKGPVPTDKQLSLALEALSTYHDKNSPVGDGTMVFWPQSYNSTAKLWSCQPANLQATAKNGDKVLNSLHRVLDDLGLGKMWNSTFLPFQEMVDSAVPAFHIPPDFDDTFVNLGLGSMLSQQNPTFFQHWKANNTNFTQAFQALKKYAYRPLSDTDSAIIDPRTYFYMREFLQGIGKQKNSSSPAFVATWMHAINEEYKTRFAFGMPFHVNNVDLTVSANVVYGITTAVLSKMANPEEWFDEDVQTIYENTTNLIAWMAQRNFSSRPDLALTYYPSVYNFYWFTSRTLYLLQSHTSSALPHHALTRTLATLSAVMRGNVTADLLKRFKAGEDGTVYFEDFLGANDRDLLGKPVNHGDDRLCSTAMAVNTLFYTWMTGDKLLEHTPREVKEVVGNASLWLVKNAKKATAFNVVFSGSVKSHGTLPFFYPNNVYEFLNGSTPAQPQISSDVIYGIRGVIPEADYKMELKKRHFGEFTIVDFYGYNQGYFPFWSSEPFTHAATLLALSRYRALVQSGQLPQY